MNPTQTFSGSASELGSVFAWSLGEDKNDPFLSLVSLSNAIYHSLQEPILSLTASTLPKAKIPLSLSLSLSLSPLFLSLKPGFNSLFISDFGFGLLWFRLGFRSFLINFKLAIENHETTVREIKPKNRRIMVLSFLFFILISCILFFAYLGFDSCSVFSSGFVFFLDFSIWGCLVLRCSYLGFDFLVSLSRIQFFLIWVLLFNRFFHLGFGFPLFSLLVYVCSSLFPSGFSLFSDSFIRVLLISPHSVFPSFLLCFFL